MSVKKVIEYGDVVVVPGLTLSGTAGPGTVLEAQPGSRAKLNTISGAPLELLVVLSPDETAVASGQTHADASTPNIVRPLPGTVLNVPTTAGSAASGGIPMTVGPTGVWKDAALATTLAPAAITSSGINNSGLTGTPTNIAGSGINTSLVNKSGITHTSSLVAASGINVDVLVLTGLSGTPDNSPIDVANPSASGTMESGQIICINKNFKEMADQIVTQRALNSGLLIDHASIFSGMEVQRTLNGVVLNDLATLFTQLALVKTDLAAVRTSVSGFTVMVKDSQAKAISMAARDANGFTQVRII